MNRRPSAFLLTPLVALATLILSSCADRSSQSGPTTVAISEGDGGASGSGMQAVKVEVCHVDDEGGFKQISIAEPAWPAHQAHGDHLAVSGVDCSTPVCTFEVTPIARTITQACSLSTGSLSVTVTNGCTWSAVSSVGTAPVSWLQVISGGGPRIGTGAAQTVTYSSATNRHQDSRSATISILNALSSPTSAVSTLTQVAGHACP